MSLERAKSILTETLFPKSSYGLNDLANLRGRPLTADSLIYRLTFDPEDDDDDDDGYYHQDDDEKQLFTINGNNLTSSTTINDSVDNMLNVWSSSNWDNQRKPDDHNNNDYNQINESECPSTIKSSPAIKLNVSSLADEIIDSELNSLKCLQIRPQPETIKSTVSTSTVTISDTNQREDDQINGITIDLENQIQSTGQCPSNGRKHWKSLILPSLMRGAINTETSIISFNCPPTRACLSCCIIS